MPDSAALLARLHADVVAEGGVPDAARALSRLVQQRPWDASDALATLAASGLSFASPRLLGLLLHRLDKQPAATARHRVDRALEEASDGWNTRVEDAATLRPMPIWLLAARAGIAAPHPEASAWVALYRDLARALSPLEAILVRAAEMTPPRGLHGLLVEQRNGAAFPVDPCGRPAWLHALAFRAGAHDGQGLAADNRRFLQALTLADVACAREPDGRTPADYLVNWWFDTMPEGTRYAVIRAMEPTSPDHLRQGWVARMLLADGVNPTLATACIPCGILPPWVRELPPFRLWQMTSVSAQALADLVEAEGIASAFSQHLAQALSATLASAAESPDGSAPGKRASLRACLPWEALGPPLLAACIVASATSIRSSAERNRIACDTAAGWLEASLPSSPILSSASCALVERAMLTKGVDRNIRLIAASLLRSATAARLTAPPATAAPRHRA